MMCYSVVFYSDYFSVVFIYWDSCYCSCLGICEGAWELGGPGFLWHRWILLEALRVMLGHAGSIWVIGFSILLLEWSGVGLYWVLGYPVIHVHLLWSSFVVERVELGGCKMNVLWQVVSDFLTQLDCMYFNTLAYFNINSV